MMDSKARLERALVCSDAEPSEPVSISTGSGAPQATKMGTQIIG